MARAATALPPLQPARRWPVLRALPPEVMAIAVGIVIWEVLGRALQFPFFPPLSKVVASGIALVKSGAVGVNLLASLTALSIGFAASVGTGVAIGVLMGRVPLAEIALGPYVNALLAAPSLVFVPILFIFFGVSDITRVAVVFLYTVFIIIVNTATAVRTADPGLVEMGRVFGASPSQMLRRVVLPDALPLTMAGIRVGMGRAVKGMINGEMFIAYVGLGAQLKTLGGTFDASGVLAILLIVIAVAATAGWFVQALDRRLTWWAN
jgi:NitT/TauT family transport system permease protein